MKRLPTLTILALVLACPGMASSAEPRRGGDLIVHDPPRTPSRHFAGRLRSHVDGGLSAGRQRVWIGPAVPWWLPLTVGTQELFILDRVDGGHLAFYRDPYGARSCTLSAVANCAYTVRLYDAVTTEPRWSLALNRLMSRKDHLEIQDIRYEGGYLYFNEACASYSKGASGRCSSLVAVDMRGEAPKVAWRTDHLVSNNRFLLLPRYIVAGYGFTSEKDYVRVIDRRDGRVRVKRWVKSAPEGFRVEGADSASPVLVVSLYGGESRRFAMSGFDGERPRIRQLK